MFSCRVMSSMRWTTRLHADVKEIFGSRQTRSARSRVELAEAFLEGSPRALGVRVATIRSDVLYLEAVVAVVAQWQRAANLSEQLGNDDPVAIATDDHVRRHTEAVAGREAQSQACHRQINCSVPFPHSLPWDFPVRPTDQVWACGHPASARTKSSRWGTQVHYGRATLDPHLPPPFEPAGRTDQAVEQGCVVVAVVRLAFGHDSHGHGCDI